MKAYLISTGSELLRGQINEDVPLVTSFFYRYGVPTLREVTLPDDAQALKEEITRALAVAEVVLVLGGLGPTHDDLTRQVLADLTGEPLEFHEAYFQRIWKRLQRNGFQDPEMFRPFALLPRGFEILYNPVGLAPGLLREISPGRYLVALPGPPREVRAVLPTLRERLPLGDRPRYRTLHVFGYTEPEILQVLSTVLPKDLNFSIIANASGIHLTVPVDPPEVLHRLRERLGEDLYGENGESLAYVVGRELRRRGWTLAAAESCTGGLVASTLTDLHGSSDFFVGSLVTYSNEAKIRILGVSHPVLLTEGAVSEPVAAQMAEGARRKLGADVGISTTGIAGPTGGTPKKPVGLVYLGVSVRGHVQVYRHLFSGDRLRVKARSTFTLLDHLRRRLRATQ